MKLKAFSIVGIMMLAVTALQAQVTFGLVAGPNFQNMVGKDYDGDKITNGLIVGFHAGAKANIPVAPDFWFQTGLLFSQKGSDNNLFMYGKKSSGEEYYNNTRISYLELPIHLLYSPELGNGRLLLGFGPYVAYGITGKQTFKDGSSDGIKIQFKNQVEMEDYSPQDEVYFRGFDAGADIFAGYEFAFGLYAQLNAQLGMLNMMTDITEWEYEPNLKNTGFGLSVGYNF